MESGHQTNYSMLSENQRSLRPPPYRRNIPRYHSTNHKKSGSSCCFRCIGCCYCCLFLLVFLAALLTFYLYTMYKPQVPNYSVDNFSVNTFNVMKDFSLSAEFVVVVKATNPNEHIGFIYGADNHVIVMYSNSDLCSGNLPTFHQPVMNATLMKVVLKGESEFGSGLQEALMDNRHTGKIPLLVRVKVPVSIVLGSLPLRQIVVFVNCSLVLDNLQPDKKAKILSTQYSYDVQL
ncbi:Late embryogenesis abundant (LEA) hydroxyproline-rich glycoprotein family [Parasponia andersonii]|uniref:Late embryogenesis abundant (LEA) hydroxyproline-rich glycoprotein family n=1 Tax=Parasponia andersonii TaxID=3476 RepID=A0A2P5AA56_PARAD|nr:Late embryogenesis abundant (LEA) hydroxyproline-rich glycoprotein family [Parasponia andersonii]